MIKRISFKNHQSLLQNKIWDCMSAHVQKPQLSVLKRTMLVLIVVKFIVQAPITCAKENNEIEGNKLKSLLPSIYLIDDTFFTLLAFTLCNDGCKSRIATYPK